MPVRRRQTLRLARPRALVFHHAKQTRIFPGFDGRLVSNRTRTFLGSIPDERPWVPPGVNKGRKTGLGSTHGGSFFSGMVETRDATSEDDETMRQERCRGGRHTHACEAGHVGNGRGCIDRRALQAAIHAMVPWSRTTALSIRFDRIFDKLEDEFPSTAGFCD